MDMVKEQIPGIYIHSLQIGDCMIEDILNGFLKPIHEQVPKYITFSFPVWFSATINFYILFIKSIWKIENASLYFITDLVHYDFLL